mmetsp:Transcript_1596/g.3437  ORF Transcript_1596/g.3437 Transcript_1596/m.3437 type:complete len:199 (+) Transcript_1596:35-631(+)
MVALGTCTNWLTSTVTVAVSFGWRFASLILIRQSPMRFVLSVASTLVREGFKVKVDTWINKQQRERRSKFFSGMRLTLKNTIRWASRKKRKIPQSEEVHNVVALDAGMKYKELAVRRLNVARSSFERAAVELKAAERGMKDAEKYVKSLRSHCEKVENQNGVNDVVFVEHGESQNDGEKIESSKDFFLVDKDALVSTD